MTRLALGLAVAAAGLSFAALVYGPHSARAFEMESDAVTLPGSTTKFGDPDETPLPAPLPSVQLNDEDGTSSQAAPGASLQIAPGTTLQIGPGGSFPMAPGMGLEMAPMGAASDNPADNKALIPTP